jgi:hypothetical protein
MCGPSGWPPASAIKVLLRGNDFRADQQSSIDNVPNIVH